MKSLLLHRARRRAARVKMRFSGEVSSEDLTLLGSIPEFDLIFSDDSRQNSPWRPGMAELAAVGGIGVAASAVWELGNAIEETCSLAGFPSGEEFKWSPGRGLWMHDSLVHDNRRAFFSQIIAHLVEHEANVAVVVVERGHKSATGSRRPRGRMPLRGCFLGGWSTAVFRRALAHRGNPLLSVWRAWR